MALRFYIITVAGGCQTAIVQQAAMLVSFVILVPARVVSARLLGDAKTVAATGPTPVQVAAPVCLKIIVGAGE